MKAIVLGDRGQPMPHERLATRLHVAVDIGARCQNPTRLSRRASHDQAVVQDDSRLQQQEEEQEQDGDDDWFWGP